MPTLTLTLTSVYEQPAGASPSIQNWTIVSPWASGTGMIWSDYIVAGYGIGGAFVPGDWSVTLVSATSVSLGGIFYEWAVVVNVTGPDWYNALGLATTGNNGFIAPLPFPYFGLLVTVTPGGGTSNPPSFARMCSQIGIPDFRLPTNMVTGTIDGMEIDWSCAAASTSGAPLAMVYWPAIESGLIDSFPTIAGNGLPVTVGTTARDTLVGIAPQGRIAIAIDTNGYWSYAVNLAEACMPSNPCEAPDGTIYQATGNAPGEYAEFYPNGVGRLAKFVGPPGPNYHVSAALRFDNQGRMWWLYQQVTESIDGWPWLLGYSDDRARTTVRPGTQVWGPTVRLADFWITPDQGAVSVGVLYDPSTGAKQALFKRCVNANLTSWPADSEAVVIADLTQLSSWRIFGRLVSNRAQLVATNSQNLLFTSDDLGRTWNAVDVAIFDSPMLLCDMIPTLDGGAIAAGTFIPPIDGYLNIGSVEVRVKRCADPTLASWPSDYVSVNGDVSMVGNVLNWRLLQRRWAGAGRVILLPGYVCDDGGRSWNVP